MKYIFTAFLFFSFLVPAISQKREYYSSGQMKIKPEYASYYQVVTKTVNAAGETLYLVEQHYMSDGLKMTGGYADKKLRVKEGVFVYYSENGQKTTEATYSNNDLNGRSAEYFSSGQVLQEQFYVNGAPEGKCTRYYSDGVISWEGFYTAGKLQGESIGYHTNGQISSKRIYKNDERTGDAFDYYESGQVSGEEHYVRDKLDGSCRWYHPNGQVSSIERYFADSLVSFELFNPDGTPDFVSETPGNGPEFPGGHKALRQFLAETLNYPESARNFDLEGRVYLKFSITPEGKVKDIVVIKGVPDCPEFDHEALRVLKLMPKWIPGKSHNRLADTYFNLPITFTLM